MNNQQDYSNDEYEMMKMMMEFSNKQESGNYYDLMQQMQKFQQHDGHRRYVSCKSCLFNLPTPGQKNSLLSPLSV